MPDRGLADMVMDIQYEITRPQASALKNERELISFGRTLDILSMALANIFSRFQNLPPSPTLRFAICTLRTHGQGGASVAELEIAGGEWASVLQARPFTDTPTCCELTLTLTIYQNMNSHSRGRKRNTGITWVKNFKCLVVYIRPPKWEDTKIRIMTEDYLAAQYVTDAVYYYLGRPSFYFPKADFRYPPLKLTTGEYLATTEQCSAYVAEIAKGSPLLCRRRDFIGHVEKLIQDMVKSPEAVQFLNSMRKSPSQVPHLDASKCGNLVLEAANSELQTCSTSTVNVRFDIKEAAVLPLVKQYFRDDHDLDVSLPRFMGEEDDKGCAVLRIFCIPSSTSPSTIVSSLVEVARYWRSQKKKTLLLKLLPPEYDQILYPSLEAGFTIHQVQATCVMLVQDLLAHVQLDPVEKASFHSSCLQALSLVDGSLDSWKMLHRGNFNYKDVQIADSCFPSARARWHSDIHSFEMICSEILRGRFPYDTPSGQDVTIDQDLPHSIPGPGAVGTPEMKQRVKHPVVVNLPSSADCVEEPPGDELDSESEAMDVPTDEKNLSGESGESLESHTEIASADSHGPRAVPSRKRSAASAFYADNLFAQIRSYVNQQIEEALLPLMSALQSREEDEHKHRQKILALEQEKLALMRQKLEWTRRSNAVLASITKSEIKKLN